MKQLTCEMCGGTDLVKQDGVFVCQSCGIKYSVEEAKKMMVEGVVEVTGTVKVDNSEKVEKILINARRAYSDKNYKEAQSLFGQVLNEQTDNYEAILFQGLSLGWQGNTVKYYMDQAGGSTERALEVSQKINGNSEESYSFASEAINGLCDLGFALSDLCIKNMNSAIDTFNKQLEDLKRRQKALPFGSDVSYLKRELDRDQTYMNEQVEKYRKINDNTLLIVLSAFDKAVDLLENIEISDDLVYIGYGFFSNAFIKLALLQKRIVYKITSEKAQKVSERIVKNTNVFRQKMEEEKQKKEQERKDRIDAYWNEHIEEKNKLIEEKNSNNNQKSELELQIEAYTNQLNSYINEKDKLVPAMAEIQQLNYTISRLTQEKAELGILKGKEKKEIDFQISELEKKISVLNTTAYSQKIEQNNIYQNKINEVQDTIAKLQVTLNEVNERIKSIDYELTKDRNNSVKNQLNFEEVKKSIVDILVSSEANLSAKEIADKIGSVSVLRCSFLLRQLINDGYAQKIESGNTDSPPLYCSGEKKQYFIEQ